MERGTGAKSSEHSGFGHLHKVAIKLSDQMEWRRSNTVGRSTYNRLNYLFKLFLLNWPGDTIFSINVPEFLKECVNTWIGNVKIMERVLCI